MRKIEQAWQKCGLEILSVSQTMFSRLFSCIFLLFSSCQYICFICNLLHRWPDINGFNYLCMLQSEIVKIIYTCRYATLISQIKKKYVDMSRQRMFFYRFPTISLMCNIPDRSSQLSMNSTKLPKHLQCYNYLNVYAYSSFRFRY